jgi:ATP-dependent RNA helicase RhlE
LLFTELGLHPDLIAGIEALRYTTVTPIQEKAIPLIIQGKDLIGVAQTGTGKTAAFILPVLHNILNGPSTTHTQALVIVPTRELALQIDQVVEAYSYFTGVSSIAVYGGNDSKSFNVEKSALTKGADIIIATPGRLIAHMNMGYVDFSKLRYLILDEADRMLDMGFQPDLLRIIDKLNPKRQTMLFSATMLPGVMKLAKTMLRNPEMISFAVSKPAEGIDQKAYLVNGRQKNALILELLRDRKDQRIIVFASTKQAVNSLYQDMKARHIVCNRISSDLEQTEREQVMQDFRSQKTNILIATDVLSRGIDVEGIDLVINYNVPREAEDYVHRVGRTARASKKGEAITLISAEDQMSFRRIEKLIEKVVEKLPLPAHIGILEDAPKSEKRHSRHSSGRPADRKSDGTGRGKRR